LAYPDTRSGSADIQTANEFDSVEVLFRKALLCQCGRQLDFLIGYRYARFDENLSINSTIETVSQVSDQFATTNEFNGAELGFAAKTHCCRWSMELVAKLALGCTNSQATVAGSTTSTASTNAAAVTQPVGFLAQSTNSGTYQQSNFAVIPELDATLAYDITCRLRATVGYTFLYWSQVARPGDEINTNLPSGLFKFVTSDFWAQGLTAGLDYRF
jgi:hypothetical protein